MIQIAVLGAQGRMGQWVTKLIQDEFGSKARVQSTIDRGDSMEALLGCDVIIDFSTPEAVVTAAKFLNQAKSAALPALVVGSTGWRIDDRRVVEDLSELTPVLMSSNFSTGVLAVLQILKTAAPMLEKLGYTPTIVETHHKHKKDAPSGTAISFQRAISPSGPGNVQTQSVRAGEVIGDHEATFYGSGDHITIGHFAQDRSIFARGAIECAIWLASRRSGAHALKGMVSIETFFKERFL